MPGSHALLSLLVDDEGVTRFFGNPGTTELPLALARSDFRQNEHRAP